MLRSSTFYYSVAFARATVLRCVLWAINFQPNNYLAGRSMSALGIGSNSRIVEFETVAAVPTPEHFLRIVNPASSTGLHQQAPQTAICGETECEQTRFVSAVIRPSPLPPLIAKVRAETGALCFLLLLFFNCLGFLLCFRTTSKSVLLCQSPK